MQPNNLFVHRKTLSRHARTAAIHMIKGACTALGTILMTAAITWLQQR
ncbi:hypothetical protein SUDANB150_07778 (plasmid) [Streptomyces sp. enrichment culture]